MLHCLFLCLLASKYFKDKLTGKDKISHYLYGINRVNKKIKGGESMIEIVKEETMEEREARRGREDSGGLPKNIRQIGECDSFERIYIEDYVMTHMKQLAAYGDETPKVLILYGSRKMVEGMLIWFVSGVIQAEVIDPFMEKIVFDEKAWKQINDAAGTYYNNLSVVGWALLRKNLDSYWDNKIIGTHREFFRVDQKIYFEYIMNERIENMYLFEEGKMEKQPGYYIYYDKNEAMQNYMLSHKEIEIPADGDGPDKELEPEVDQAARRFRSIVQEKKEQIHKKNTTTLLYGTSAVLVMVIMVIGITMLNNYEKMQNMEKVLYQISGKIEEDNEVAAADKPQAEKVQAVDVAADKSDDAVKPETVETVAMQQEDQATNQQEDSAQIPAEQPETATDTNQNSDQAENGSEADKQENQETAQNEEQQTMEEDTQTEGDDTAQGEQTEAPADNGDAEAASANESSQITETTSPWTYTIKRGDTLVKISYRYYGTGNMVAKICELNNIQNMDSILYGEKILLP